MHKHLTVAALLAAVLAGAHAEVIDIKWSADGRFSYRGQLAAGKFVELCGKLPAALAVRWDFEAGAPLDFNVHYHVGKEVVFPFKLSAVAIAKDALVTPVEQDYCWMWSNKSATTVTLAVNLRR